mgnify:FL=1
MKWSEQKEAELISLWKTGLTFREIGERLGMNRCMVAGKLSRMG